jgi:hypothetical protein
MRIGDPPKEKMNLMSLLQRRRSSLREWVIQNLKGDQSYEALVAKCTERDYVVPSSADWATAFPPDPVVAETPPVDPEPRNALVELPDPSTSSEPAPRRRRRSSEEA